MFKRKKCDYSLKHNKAIWSEESKSFRFVWLQVVITTSIMSSNQWPFFHPSIVVLTCCQFCKRPIKRSDKDNRIENLSDYLLPSRNKINDEFLIQSLFRTEMRFELISKVKITFVWQTSRQKGQSSTYG